MTDSGLSNSFTSKPTNKQPLGQLLNEAGLISAQQIEIALRYQLINNSELKIGEIFASRGWIKQQTADFFVNKWNYLINQEPKKPLVYYFREAALLDENQINSLLEERNHSNPKIRFHHLAVKKGLIKLQTVEFFIENLLAPTKGHQSVTNSQFTTPYELLKNYIRGETNFQRSDLKKIKLNHVTLKGVNLNHSNLSEAELKQANLSNSSLRLANLNHANLEKAILKEVDFECACLTQVNFTDAHLEGSNFKQANLKNADLRDGYFVNVCLQGADLRNTKLQGTNFEGATYNSQTIFDPDFDPVQVGMKLVDC
ncbi:MAG: pentapeptide repeat-containing protein [Waterburya sp.]